MINSLLRRFVTFPVRLDRTAVNVCAITIAAHATDFHHLNGFRIRTDTQRLADIFKCLSATAEAVCPAREFFRIKTFRDEFPLRNDRNEEATAREVKL
jgi:hypothetical protein